MNLAILAIELGEPERAIDRAEVACSVLQSSGNRVLWGLARVIKGEALVDAARLPAASDVFSGVLDDYTEANHPLALAGAHRGFGRIYLAAGRTADAIGTLERALGLFERLKRVQEAGRTEVHIAKAYEFNGDTAACVSFLERALAKFTAIGASRDVERTEALLQNLRLKLD